MTTGDIKRGWNTTVNVDYPSTANGGDQKYVRAKTGAKRVLLHFPVGAVRGRTVLSAQLIGHVKGAQPDQLLTLRRLVGDWDAAGVTWNTQPADTGVNTGTTLQTGALADGAEIILQATAMLQTVANGAPWYGFKLITNSGTDCTFHGFASPLPSWTLHYELSDAPDQPTALVPDGGVVSVANPILSWDFSDFGAGSTTQAAFQVQIDPNASATAPLFDTGTVLATDPLYDTAQGVSRTVSPIGVVVNSLIVTAPAATWTASDVGATITGTGIPANTRIAAIGAGGLSATMTNRATVSTTSGTATVTRFYPGLTFGLP